MCPLYKTVGMMRSIIAYFDEAKKLIMMSAQTENKINWSTILA